MGCYWKVDIEKPREKNLLFEMEQTIKDQEAYIDFLKRENNEILERLHTLIQRTPKDIDYQQQLEKDNLYLAKDNLYLGNKVTELRDKYVRSIDDSVLLQKSANELENENKRLKEALSEVHVDNHENIDIIKRQREQIDYLESQLEEVLNEECICSWSEFVTGDYFRTECGAFIDVKLAKLDFDFCPYCGLELSIDIITIDDPSPF